MDYPCTNCDPGVREYCEASAGDLKCDKYRKYVMEGGEEADED